MVIDLAVDGQHDAAVFSADRLCTGVHAHDAQLLVREDSRTPVRTAMSCPAAVLVPPSCARRGLRFRHSQRGELEALHIGMTAMSAPPDTCIVTSTDTRVRYENLGFILSGQ